MWIQLYLIPHSVYRKKWSLCSFNKIFYWIKSLKFYLNHLVECCNRLFRCNRTCYCIVMVSVTSASRYVTLASHCIIYADRRRTSKVWFHGIGRGRSDWICFCFQLTMWTAISCSVYTVLPWWPFWWLVPCFAWFCAEVQLNAAVVIRT